jgi:hypothetical protein
MPTTSTASTALGRPLFVLSDASFVKQVEATREALRVFLLVASVNTQVTKVAMEELVNTTVRGVFIFRILDLIQVFRFVSTNSGHNTSQLRNSRSSRQLFELRSTPSTSDSPLLGVLNSTIILLSFLTTLRSISLVSKRKVISPLYFFLFAHLFSYQLKLLLSAKVLTMPLRVRVTATVRSSFRLYPLYFTDKILTV